jgi:predicted acylesterase/phospholipase RssA
VATALVLSAGGLYAAWEVGVWTALRGRLQFDMIIGASAGAWNGWAIAGGATPEELREEWLDPRMAGLMQPGLHAGGILKPDALHRKARELYHRFQPRIPFALTMVEVPRLRVRLFRESEIAWEHLAGTSSIPFCFPPVRIAGKRYVDGGLRGALPLWAAAEMGANRAIAVNALIHPLFRLLHRAMLARQPAPGLDAIRIEPSRPLGPLWDAMVWSKGNIERWIRMGEEDGNRAVTSISTSITM